MRPGGARRSNSASLSWPMPCSAEIEPPAAVTRSSTRCVIVRALARRTSRARRGLPARTWKWMLPSPKMAEAAGDDAGELALDLGRGFGDEARHVGDRDRDVVRERLPFRALGLGDGVAELPEGLGLRLVGGDRRVGDDALLKRRGEQLLELGIDVGVGDRRSLLRRARATACVPDSGARVSGMCFSTSSSESCGTSSKPFDGAGARFEEAQQIERLRRAFDAGPCDRARRQSPARAAARRR